MKVYMLPSKAVLGIQRVLDAYQIGLAAYGVQFVDNADGADIIAVHAGEQASKHPDVTHCHGLYPTAQANHNNLGLFQMNRQVLDNIRGASAFTVPSNWVADLFRHDMLLDPVIVPHGVDVHEFDTLRTANHEGYVVWGKGHNAPVCDYSVVNALAMALPKRKFVSTVAEQANNIQVIGYQSYEAMKKWLSTAEIYLANVKETFGIQTLEALALGIPVVGYKWGALPDIIEHGVQGYLAEPGNIDDLVSGIEWVSANRTVLSANAIERAKQFSWYSAVSMVYELYNTVLHHKNTKSGGVSIIIPCYNYEKWVGQAIKSALTQEFNENLEVIVVNDGSTDNSEAVIQQFPDVKYIKQANCGVAEARNNGIRHAKGDFIVCLDADDELNPGFLNALYPTIKDNPDIGIVYGNLTLKDGEDHLHKSNWPVQFDFTMQVRQENCIPACNVFRKEAWFRAGGYRQQYIPCEDAELWLRMTALGYKAMMVTESPVYTYRLHDKGATRTKEQTDWARDKPWHLSVSTTLFGSVPSEWVSYPVRNYDQPWITVIIPVGPGHEHLVSRAIDSVWLQIMPYWQVIVVNDSGSILYQDSTGSLLEEAYPFIEMYTTPVAGNGPAVARNIGAKHAKADFLLFLDADDGLMMECLHELVRTYNDNNGESYVYSDWYSYDGKSRHIHETEEFDVKSLWAQALHPITALIPKAWFDDVGGFDETLPGWEDWELFIKIAKKHCGVRVPLPLMAYDVSSGKKRENDYANVDKSLAAIRAKHKETEMCLTCKDKVNPQHAAEKSEPAGAQLAIAAGDEVLVYDNSGNKGMHGVYGIRTGRSYGGKVHGEQFIMTALDQKMQPHLYIIIASADVAAQLQVEKPEPPPQPIAPPPPVTLAPKVAESVKAAVVVATDAGKVVEPVIPLVAPAPELPKPAPIEEAFELDLSLLNPIQIRNMGIDKETAAMGIIAEQAGLNRPEVLAYLEKVANG